MKSISRPYPDDKYAIALTGGIASGKSSAAEIFKELGAGIVDTDAISRDVVKKGSPVLDEIRKKWGDKVLNPDGSLNRAELADIIFSSAEDREELNKIIHPAIINEMIERVKSLKERVVILVIPLLFEAKIPICYDEAWLVYSPPEVQKERLIKRDKISAEEAEKRINSQFPIDEKIKMAKVAIDNSTDLKNLREEAVREWNRLNQKLDSL